MAKMIPLDPVPKQPLPRDGWELIATEAGRYAAGLCATVQLWNGHMQAVQQLALAKPKTWVTFINQVAAQLSVDAPESIAQAVMTLAAGVEGVLRSMEAQPDRRDRSDEPEGQGEAITFVDDDEAPWPEAVDGAMLLERITATYRRYLVLPPGGAHTLALWTVHTHAHDVSSVSPMLALQSPEKRCGKTTTLQILSGLVARALPCSNITPAALFRTVDRYRPTLVLDEADTFLSAQHDDLRGVLNSGHTRATAYVIRTVGDDHDPRRFSTWCPKAIALIGALPTTLADRSITLRLQRKARGETVQRWRVDRAESLSDLRRQIARWVTDHGEALAQADPKVPDSLHDRAADNWRPLLAIADLAGSHWPQRAREALQALEAVDDDDTELGGLLLQDLHDLFITRNTDRLASVDICEALADQKDRPWPTVCRDKPITPHRLARMLAAYGIVPGSVRLNGDKTAKGYTRESCQNAFTRYIPPNQNGTTAQGTSGAGQTAKIETAQEPAVPFQKMTQNPELSRVVPLCHFESSTPNEKIICRGCQERFVPLTDGASKTLCRLCQAELRKGAHS
jgi:hypothetical protein